MWPVFYEIITCVLSNDEVGMCEISKMHLRTKKTNLTITHPYQIICMSGEYLIKLLIINLHDIYGVNLNWHDS